MSVYTESGIAFDFSAAVSHQKHDAPLVNQVWEGVDFIIEEPDRWIWLEVKNWEPSTMLPRERSGARRTFLAKMRPVNGFFTQVLRAKFVGTVAFLCLTGAAPTKKVLYVMLLESPKLDSAMKTRAGDIMRSQIPKKGPLNVPWRIRVSVLVLSLADWQSTFVQYPAQGL